MKYYTVKEFAKKLRVSEGHIYDLVKNGEIQKANTGRVIRIPSNQISVIKDRVTNNFFTFDSDRVEVIETSLGKIRKLKTMNYYILKDVTTAIGIHQTQTIKDAVDECYIKKLDLSEAQKLGLRCNYTGLLIIAVEGLNEYCLKTRDNSKGKILLKELKTIKSYKQLEVPKKSIKHESIETLNFVESKLEPKNTIRVLEQREVLGQAFKIYGTYENPLFLAKDVAEWIEYSKRQDGSYQVGQMLKVLDEDEKISTVNNINGKEMWFLTEDGLYEVLMQSRKPIAKEFKKQIKVILKDIRLTGGYVGNSAKFVDNYFSNLNRDVKLTIKLELENRNKILFTEKEKIDKELSSNINVIKSIEKTFQEGKAWKKY